MRKSRFTEAQIIAVLKEGEAGVAVAEILLEARHQSQQIFQLEGEVRGGRWVHELRRLRELEAENARLKRMYSELALENAPLKDVVHRKW